MRHSSFVNAISPACRAVAARVTINANEVSPGKLAGNARRATSHGEIQHQIARVAVCLNQVPNQIQRLLRVVVFSFLLIA
jgi:hypothetical protein